MEGFISGGEYNYAYREVEEMACKLAKKKDALRRAFSMHLLAVAKAMKDVEWADSGDISEEEARASMNKVVNRETQIESLCIEGHILVRELKALITEGYEAAN